MTTQPLAAGRQAHPRASSGRASLLARIRANRWSYLYLAPFTLLVALFTIYPIIASLGYTL